MLPKDICHSRESCIMRSLVDCIDNWFPIIERIHCEDVIFEKRVRLNSIETYCVVEISEDFYPGISGYVANFK